MLYIVGMSQLIAQDKMEMNSYTVSQLASLAGISVRTLHHYDHIDLLKPSQRTEAGYRLYTEDELFRLQQIMFFKELDVPLSDIKAVLDDPDFDPINALESHRRLLAQQAQRLNGLLKTIDKTLHRLKENDMTVTDKDLYEGFTAEQIERYEREALEMYDLQTVRAANQRVRKMSKGQWQAIKEEGRAVTQAIAELIGRDSADADVQALIARHHAWIENFYDCSAEIYIGLGQLYTQHDEFRAFYEKVWPGLAEFMQAAMIHYAEHVLLLQG